jgi:UDP-N-acetylglucosamine/UDP-N-acetylgalactosamine diphosphorylase
MTSHQNHAATEAFFGENGHFGLDRAGSTSSGRGACPPWTSRGKILLETRDSLALSPDGHGGSLRALDRSGALDLMAGEGIDTLSYFQVDNPLVRCVDPAFIGWHLVRGSEMSSKMVPKAYPEEKLGHFCIRKGKLVVIEYSDLPLALQREKDPSTGGCATRRAASPSTRSTGSSSGGWRAARTAFRSTGRTRRSRPSTRPAAR